MKKSSLFLLSMLCASVALAEPPAPAPAAKQDAAALVNQQLVQPLKQAEARRSRFSRAARPPKERRVRVLDEVAQTDVHGRRFVRFAIDVRYRSAETCWKKDALVGCAYLDQKEVFLQRGADYVPATTALGKDGEPRADVCRGASGDTAQLASAAR